MPDKLQDAVQPKNWYEALPRPQYTFLEAVAQPESWFSVYKPVGGVFAIYEPGHFQEVISFLVMGEESALLIDTGMGIGDMKAVTSKLCGLPLSVVNTHSHFDHIGGNHQYPLVHIFNHPAALRRTKGGLAAEKVADNMVEGSDAAGYPAGFSPKDYHIKPCNAVGIEDGHIFDLGGRKLEVIHTPGHSPDSIMLADHENKLLFTGDTFYPATLYAHFDDSDGLASDIYAYRDTMAGLAGLFAGYTLLCSHNEPVCQGGMLRGVSQALSDIIAGEADFQTDESGLKKYSFDGFCVVTK